MPLRHLSCQLSTFHRVQLPEQWFICVEPKHSLFWYKSFPGIHSNSILHNPSAVSWPWSWRTISTLLGEEHKLFHALAFSVLTIDIQCYHYSSRPGSVCCFAFWNTVLGVLSLPAPLSGVPITLQCPFQLLPIGRHLPCQCSSSLFWLENEMSKRLMDLS